MNREQFDEFLQKYFILIEQCRVQKEIVGISQLMVHTGNAEKGYEEESMKLLLRMQNDLDLLVTHAQEICGASKVQYAKEIPVTLKMH